MASAMPSSPSASSPSMVLAEAARRRDMATSFAFMFGGWEGAEAGQSGKGAVGKMDGVEREDWG